MSASLSIFNHDVAPVFLTETELKPYLNRLDVAACLRDLFLALAQDKAVQPAQSGRGCRRGCIWSQVIAISCNLR